jgi:hypothetical protein
MRGLKATGLLLALGWLAARSFAEELQWRSATPIQAGQTSSTDALSPWNTAKAPSNPSPASVLSRPVPVNRINQVD